MPDTKQLPYLLKLIDDDSDFVREKVMAEFEAFGPDLELELENLSDPPDVKQRLLLHDLLMENRKKLLKREWRAWLELRDEHDKLETAFELLADYMNGRGYPAKLRSQLDLLAAEYRSIHDEADAMTLARFLFNTRSFKGADSDYYSPYNSDLVYVIQTKRGLPISLACLYMLIGQRLNIDIKGCNMPGHFFARVIIGGQIYLVDCYNGGQFFLADEFQPVDGSRSVNISRLINNPPDAETIFRRILMNLIRAYQNEDRSDESGFFIELLTALNERTRGTV